MKVDMRTEHAWVAFVLALTNVWLCLVNKSHRGAVTRAVIELCADDTLISVIQLISTQFSVDCSNYLKQ